MVEKCRLHEENIGLKIKGVESHVSALIEIQEQANRFQNEKLHQILEQTLKTNGRVTALEKKTYIWVWLTDKPYRLLAAIIGVVSFSRIVTNEMLWELILKIFK
jgi:hypothetical protein